MLRCGFYEVDITPNIGDNVPGYFNAREASEIYDTLYAHAFAVQADGEPMLMISLDAIVIQKNDADLIRKGIYAATGIPITNISLCAIHTHTGGPVCDLYDCPRREPYCAFMVNRTIDAGIMAFNRMADAKIGADSRLVEGIAFNRRFEMKDGSFRMNPGMLNPDIVRSVDVTDPELVTIRVDYADGTPMGAIASYALHLDTVGASVYSADYPGVIRKNLRKAYGENFGFLYMTGTCGNINHIDVTKPREEQKNYRSIGAILSAAVEEAFASIKTADTNIARCARTCVTGMMRRPTVEMAESQPVADIRKEMLRAVALPVDPVVMEVWTALIGDIAFQMLPGEVFAYFGLEAKKRSTAKYTISCELSNQNIGYIYTKEAEKQGGYEATPSTYIIMNSDAGYQIVDAASANLEKIC